MKSVLIGFFFSVVSLGAFAGPSQQQATPPTINRSPKLVDCNALDEDEQEFSSKLSNRNKTLFCGQFTPVQRASAMELAEERDSEEAALTPDEAVQEVAKDNKLIPLGSKGARGCPVK